MPKNFSKNVKLFKLTSFMFSVLMFIFFGNLVQAKTVTVTMSSDNILDSGNASQNKKCSMYGDIGSTNLYGGHNYRYLAKVKLGSVPYGYVLTKATLRNDRVSSSWDDDQKYVLFETNSDWSPSSVSWANQPATSTSFTSAYFTNYLFEYDVTEMIKAKQNNSQEYFSFLIKKEIEDATLSSHKGLFACADYGTGGSENVPVLELAYRSIYAGKLVNVGTNYYFINSQEKRDVVPVESFSPEYTDAVLKTNNLNKASSVPVSILDMPIGKVLTIKAGNPYLLKKTNLEEYFIVDHDDYLKKVNKSDYPDYSVITVPDVYFATYAVVTETGLPDLTITAVEQSLGTETIGGVSYDTVGFNVTFKNIGAVDAGDFKLSMATGKTDEYANGFSLVSSFSYYFSTSVMKVGQNYRTLMGAYLLPKGKSLNATFKFSVDTEKNINESNENNNVFEKTVSINQSAALPDLIISRIDFSNESVRVYYKNASGQTIPKTQRNEIVIELDSFSKSYTEGFVFAGNKKDEKTADFMPYEESYIDFPALNFAQDNYLTAVVDYTGKVKESDDSNNVYKKFFASIVPSSGYPGFSIEPTKNVYKYTDDLVTTIRRLDGKDTPYNIDLLAQKNVSVGDSKNYQLYTGIPFGNGFTKSDFRTTNSIEHMTVFIEGGNGEYTLAVCPSSGCEVGKTNSVTIRIEGFPEKQKLPTKSTSDNSINRMNDNAKSLNDGKLEELLREIKQLRSELREQAAELKYLKMFASQMKDLSANMQTAMKAFITYGVDENTQKLGEGERAAVISSYEAAFDKLPTTEAELADAIKIANGRYPAITNSKAEQKAKEQFFKIYKRAPDMADEKDAAAVKVMAYGLRQKAENRNMGSETKGIKTFKHIFGNNPKTTEEWNTMQAITYSGATKKNDSDGDGLADETEKKLGTNPNNPDSDGDGYKDGTEVLKGYSPNKK